MLPSDRWQPRKLFSERLSFVLINPLRQLFTGRSKVLSWARLCPKDDVLELGPGPGFFTASLARAVAPGMVYALDVQPGMVAKLKRRLGLKESINIRCLAADAERLPMKEETVDKVFANQVLEEVADLNGAMSEIKRVLRPGGTLAIVQYWFDFTPVMRDALKAIAAAHGFLLMEETSTRLSWRARYKKA